MNTRIYKILLLKENNEKREVKFDEGVNIISGSSRSGKSALLKIFDYCFCSKRDTIPSGEIDDFTDIFSLILKYNNKYVILGRKKFSDTGSTKMFLSYETKIDIVNTIDFSYYDDKVEQSIDSVKKQLNTMFELVDNCESEPSKLHTPSIRNMMTFILQYQNLIASEHALFSRFDDFYNKKDTIDQFPIFAGWADNNYFIYIREKEKLNDEINKLEKLYEKEVNILEKQKNEIRGHCQDYYSIIGADFEEVSETKDVVEICKILPDYTDRTIISEDSRIRYINLLDEREEVKAKLSFISKRITSIEFNSKYSNDYYLNLSILKDKSKFTNVKVNHSCPLCNSDVDIIGSELKKVNAAKVDLEKELNSLSFHSKDYLHELEGLKEERETLKKEIIKISSKIKYIEEQFREIKNYKSTHDKAIYAKAQIEIKLDNVLNKSTLEDIKKELFEKRNSLTLIEKDLLGLDFSKKMQEAKKWLNKSISNVCSKLDFEERYKSPICNINFDFETFSLYIYDNINNEMVSFGRLGSASNYLACHIGLFVSLLGMFWIGKKSKVPNILFLDQPSQVYFSSEENITDAENQRVVNIYKTIIDTIETIYNEYPINMKKMKPQVIILDHAKGLLKDNFNSYLKRVWWEGEDGKLV